MHHCQRTFVAPAAIDYDRALRQHQQYCDALRRCGVETRTLKANRHLPDCAFIEDTAVVLDELAVLASMGTAARRREPAGVEPELSRRRKLQRLELPATLEGGDVLRIGRTLLVGLSSRTNFEGMAALGEIVHPLGYRVVPVPVRGCLHLKTACTALPDGRLVVNPSWLDVECLAKFEQIQVPEDEPWAANLLPIGEHVCLAKEHVGTARMIRNSGFQVVPIDLSEFAKAEGGVTCLSIVL